MSTTAILAFACTALFSLVSFFLVAFYNKVDKIATDISAVLINSAVKDEKITSMERRLTHVEETIKKNLQC
jgi:hypothetical protein